MSSDCSKVIIIEGPDGAGKSTLAEDLSLHLQWPVVHTGGPIKSRSEFRRKVEVYGLLRPETPVIYDRTPYISDRIYAPLADRESSTSALELDYMLEKVKPVVVYCSVNNAKTMKNRVLLEQKNHKPVEHLNNVLQNHSLIVQRYHQLFASLRYPHVLKFDWTKQQYRDLVQEINRRVNNVWPNIHT